MKNVSGNTITLNFVQIESRTGIKEFELVQGDITNLPFHTDILCLSAFKDDYTPTESSIIGQLFNKGIDVGELVKHPFLDFRNSLGIWVSEAFMWQPFKRILCIEIVGTENTVETCIKNLFAAISTLEIKGEENISIALPVIASGDQSLDAKVVISSMLETSLEFLRYSRYLSKVYFVVRESKAFEFNRQMNQALGRDRIKSPRGQLADILKKDLNANIDKLIDVHDGEEVFGDLKRVVNSEFRPFEFGAITRKSIERVIELLDPQSKSHFELMKKIDSLKSMGVSQWMQSYFHTIRIFGNEAVHTKDRTERIPEFVDERDLEIGMYCMSKIIEFYLDNSPRTLERIGNTRV
jgi:hypothetical protein